MNGALRLVLLLVLLQAPLVTASLVHWPDRSARFDAGRAPTTLGAYTGTADEPLEPEVLQMLRPDTYVLRKYTALGQQDVWLYLASYSRIETTGAHDPGVCYPAQGWDLRDLHERRIELPGREALTSRILLADRMGRRELVLYWFQPHGRWPQSGSVESLLRIGDVLLRRAQYVFVRLSIETTDNQEMGEEALARLARELAPWLRDAMQQPAPTS